MKTFYLTLVTQSKQHLSQQITLEKIHIANSLEERPTTRESDEDKQACIATDSGSTSIHETRLESKTSLFGQNLRSSTRKYEI